MPRLIVASVVVATSLVAPRASRADSCTPAKVMVVLDKSSSMETGTIGGVPKWDIAKAGLGNVLSAYDAKAEFGLMTFPRPNQCSPGGLDVAPALASRQQILDALASAPPASGNYTPMAQTLQVAAAEPSLSGSGPRHVILITDGWQWCDPYDPATRFDGVAAIDELAAAGITTWIVGFGAEVDAVALNRMAVEAGTARTGCNPASTDPAAADNCYFQVDNAQQLVTALMTIAGTVSGEVCDGVDNDCDGQVDENDGHLCDPGFMCTNGSCQPPPMGTDAGTQPPNDDTPGAEHAGCACNTSGGGLGGVLPAMLAGIVLLGRRRRR